MYELSYIRNSIINNVINKKDYFQNLNLTLHTKKSITFSLKHLLEYIDSINTSLPFDHNLKSLIYQYVNFDDFLTLTYTNCFQDFLSTVGYNIKTTSFITIEKCLNLCKELKINLQCDNFSVSLVSNFDELPYKTFLTDEIIFKKNNSNFYVNGFCQEIIYANTILQYNMIHFVYFSNFNQRNDFKPTKHKSFFNFLIGGKKTVQKRQKIMDILNISKMTTTRKANNILRDYLNEDELIFITKPKIEKHDDKIPMKRVIEILSLQSFLKGRFPQNWDRLSYVFLDQVKMILDIESGNIGEFTDRDFKLKEINEMKRLDYDEKIKVLRENYKDKIVLKENLTAFELAAEVAKRKNYVPKSDVSDTVRNEFEDEKINLFKKYKPVKEYKPIFHYNPSLKSTYPKEFTEFGLSEDQIEEFLTDEEDNPKKFINKWGWFFKPLINKKGITKFQELRIQAIDSIHNCKMRILEKTNYQHKTFDKFIDFYIKPQKTTLGNMDDWEHGYDFFTYCIDNEIVKQKITPEEFNYMLKNKRFDVSSHLKKFQLIRFWAEIEEKEKEDFWDPNDNMGSHPLGDVKLLKEIGEDSWKLSCKIKEQILIKPKKIKSVDKDKTQYKDLPLKNMYSSLITEEVVDHYISKSYDYGFIGIRKHSISKKGKDLLKKRIEIVVDNNLNKNFEQHQIKTSTYHEINAITKEILENLPVIDYIDQRQYKCKVEMEKKRLRNVKIKEFLSLRRTCKGIKHDDYVRWGDVYV